MMKVQRVLQLIDAETSEYEDEQGVMKTWVHKGMSAMVTFHAMDAAHIAKILKLHPVSDKTFEAADIKKWFYEGIKPADVTQKTIDRINSEYEKIK